MSVGRTAARVCVTIFIVMFICLRSRAHLRYGGGGKEVCVSARELIISPPDRSTPPRSLPRIPNAHARKNRRHTHTQNIQHTQHTHTNTEQIHAARMVLVCVPNNPFTLCPVKFIRSSSILLVSQLARSSSVYDYIARVTALYII